jgi:hypothetical protein
MICHSDVCFDCAVALDFDCCLTASPPFYHSDYPEFVCKECWNLGDDIRQRIMEVRDAAEDAEYNLLEEWRSLRKLERDKNKTENS